VSWLRAITFFQFLRSETLATQAPHPFHQEIQISPLHSNYNQNSTIPSLLLSWLSSYMFLPWIPAVDWKEISCLLQAVLHIAAWRIPQVNNVNVLNLFLVTKLIPALHYLRIFPLALPCTWHVPSSLKSPSSQSLILRYFAIWSSLTLELVCPNLTYDFPHSNYHFLTLYKYKIYIMYILFIMLIICLFCLNINSMETLCLSDRKFQVVRLAMGI
jgi:hypothetical protein